MERQREREREREGEIDRGRGSDLKDLTENVTFEEKKNKK